MNNLISFFRAIDEVTTRGREDIAEKFWEIFGPLSNFLESNGISKIWIIFFIMCLMDFIYFLFDTSYIFTGKNLSLKERWKLFWKDFDILKTMSVILTPIIFMFLFVFFGIIMIIPLILVIGLGVLHFFLSSEKYIDNKERVSFKNFRIRWTMYWKGFDLFKGIMNVLTPVGFFILALIVQILKLLGKV